MKKLASIIAVTVGIIGVIGYQLGLFDKPEFHYEATLVGREFHAILATSTEKNIGQHVSRLLSGTQNGILALPKGEALMKAGARLYSEEAPEKLAIGLYFDVPAEVDHPRWAVGWAVEGHTFEELELMVEEVKKDSGLDDPIRAVRIGTDDILKATIPWRTIFTPYIAPMLHWCKGFDKYEKDGYKDRKSEYGAISLEVYVMGKQDGYDHIDYCVLMGDTSKTWQDTFPSGEPLTLEDVSALE